MGPSQAQPYVNPSSSLSAGGIRPQGHTLAAPAPSIESWFQAQKNSTALWIKSENLRFQQSAVSDIFLRHSTQQIPLESYGLGVSRAPPSAARSPGEAGVSSVPTAVKRTIVLLLRDWGWVVAPASAGPFPSNCPPRVVSFSALCGTPGAAVTLTTDWVAVHNGDLLCLCSGGRKSKVTVPAGPAPLGA